MSQSKPVYACDCETDPFKNGRTPEPFLWGLYGEKDYRLFDKTKDFVEYVRGKKIILYAHNGGKFDFIFLLPFIKKTKAQIINGRIVSMFLGLAELRDSYAIIPQPLRDFGDKFEIEYWKLEREYRHEHMDEIKKYLEQDCKVLFDAVTAYRSIAGKRKTIAGNALAFAKKIGIDPGKSNHRFDSKMRRFYYGGRCECFRPGTHENVSIIDIHSAYPYAMIHNHATGTDFHRLGSLDGLSKEQIDRSFIKLRCFSKGAFPQRKIGHQGGIIFPHKEDEFFVTGWEYNAALEFRLLENIEILSVRSTKDTITFKPYVDYWFKYKHDHSAKDINGNRIDPVGYTIGKIMQNSLYGKLSQNPARYYDYEFHEAGTQVDNENGWSLYKEYAGHEIHRRNTLWRYQQDLEKDWEARNLYNNVATGASITGFTRAHLLRTMHSIGIEHIIYCDTDGIVCDASSDMSKVKFSDELGDWELEGKASIGHFAGKKLYGMQLSTIDKKTGKHKVKVASKGSKLAFDDLVKIVNGETVKWTNDAPTFSIDGSVKFVHREISATAILPSVN